MITIYSNPYNKEDLQFLISEFSNMIRKLEAEEHFVHDFLLTDLYNTMEYLSKEYEKRLTKERIKNGK